MKKTLSKTDDRFSAGKLGKPLPLCLLIALVVMLVYGQVRHHDFIIWDDPIYITANYHVQTGLHWDSIRWAFTTGHTAIWIPLTWLSFMLDYELFGPAAGGYHLINLLWHLLNCLLLFGILHSLTKEIWPSLFAALLFAVHPLRVESVVWVTERKDVLSAFFWLSTTWLYIRYVKTPSLKSYLPVAAGMGLGLMAKPMLVTLPFAFLLLDFWPLRRVRTGPSWIPLVREKLPLLALALLSMALTLWAQSTTLSLSPVEMKPLSLRLENALISYASYLGKMLWPVGLSVYYPYPDSPFPYWEWGLAALALAGATWLAWQVRIRFPYVLMGWLWFVGTLVPVIGVVQVSGHAMADRYTYIPAIGIFIIAAWGARDLLAAYPRGRWPVVSACIGIILALSVLCHLQVQRWRDSITLFQHALRVQEDNFLAHACLGAAFLQQGNPGQAKTHLSRALELNPRSPEAHNDLGKILMDEGNIPEAIAHLSTAITLDPHSPEAHNNLALTLTRAERFSEAVRHYETALSLNPLFPEALNNLGAALAQQGRLEEAEPYFLKALAIQPGHGDAYDNLGLLHYQRQDFKNAKLYFESSLSHHPNNPKAAFFLGLIAAAEGREKTAADYFSLTLQIDPGFQEAAERLRGLSEKQRRN